jgi:D-alanyl-D-alanine carboxypeptidase
MRSSLELARKTSSWNASKLELENQIGNLNQSLSVATTENASLTSAYAAEKERNDSFEGRISGIADTVGTLQKLSETDPELLAKYSKVYFLNENYIPSSLSPIPSQYLEDPSRKLQIHSGALPFFARLMGAAEDDNIDLKVASAYRSFGQQAALKESYEVTYGSGANAFSADQGYSEHQLGTTLDFITSKQGGSLAGFDKTPAYSWLLDNAYKYGFILSYPEGNSYYEYEPWHWRFVGIKLATDLHNEKKNFYDLDQRDIDAYLVNIFDN